MMRLVCIFCGKIIRFDICTTKD